MQKWRILIIPLLVWGTVLKAAAPNGNGGAISFSQAKEIILSQNAGLKSASSQTEAAKAGVSQAFALPNPSVGIALDMFGVNEIEVIVEQSIELGGKRRLRRDAAQNDVNLAINTHKLTQMALEAEIVRRFVPISALLKKIALIDSVIVITQATREQIQNRVNAGAAKKTDLIRIEIDIEQLKMEQSEFVRENNQARKKFAALGGELGSELVNVSGSILDDVEIPSLDVLRNALESNPELKAVDIETMRLVTHEKQLRAEVVPDLNLSAGYLRNNSDNSNSPLVGVSMNLPLFNKNIAAQKQVGLQRHAIGERRKNTQRLLNADIEDVHSRLVEIDKKIATVRTSALPKTEQVYAMMQEYYSAGSTGFLDLAAAQTEMLNLRMALLDMQIERAQKLCDLMQSTSLHIQIVK